MSYHHIKRCRKMLWELARVESWAHFEVMRRVHRGGSIEAARDEVFSLYERHGEAALSANGTPGDPVLLLSAIFPELDRADIKAATRYYQRQSRRLERWAAKRIYPKLFGRRPQGAKPKTRHRATPRRTGYRSALVRRTPVRATRTAAKSGGDDNGGDDDGGDPDGEPPRPSCQVNLSAPRSAHKFLSLKNQLSNSLPLRCIRLGCWRLSGGCSA